MRGAERGVYERLRTGLVAADDDEPVRGLVAVASNKGHVFTDRFDGPIDEPTVMEGGDSPFAGLAQIDFNVASIAQADPSALCGRNFDFLLVDFPIAFAPKHALKTLG